MKIIFFGSSEFSLSALRACKESGDVILVLTTPDQKKGRGLRVEPTPVKLYAQQNKLAVEAPEKLKSEDWVKKISDLKPDLFVVSSYGKMIPTSWLQVPKSGSWNIHPSLLPKYRGAAPINWPILNGDVETGLSIAEVTPELDAGDLYFQKKIPLPNSITAPELSKQLAEVSYDVLKQLFQDKEKDALKKSPQSQSESTYARKLEKQDGVIDWKQSAVEIDRKVRGLLPWPVASTICQGQLLKILKSGPKSSFSKNEPGELMGMDDQGNFEIQTGSGNLLIQQVLPEGKKMMTGAEFIRGKRLAPGFIFG